MTKGRGSKQCTTGAMPPIPWGMNDDEWQAHQDEEKQITELAEAIENARAAGLDPEKIMADARLGYRNLTKTKIGKDAVGKKALLRTGLYSERHGLITALQSATKRAKGERDE